MKAKMKIAQKLALDLSSIDKKHQMVFMCPVCEKTINAKKSKEITDAHIFPQAIGGKEFTLLCRRCNSDFGSKQDKWFGEYLDISIDETKNILSAKTQPKYIAINGNTYRSRIEGDNKNINIYLYEYPNNKEAISSIQFQDRLSIDFKFPLAGNIQLVTVGFLTAGYLMWFKELGYSWSLQSSLERIRKQILNPSNDSIKSRYIFKTERPVELKSKIGIFLIDDLPFPSALVAGMLVVFPSACDKGEHSKLPDLIESSKQTRFYEINLYKNHEFPPLMFFLFDDQVIVSPDTVLKGQKNISALRFNSSRNRIEQLRQVSGREYKYLEKNRNCIKKTIDIR